MRRFLSIVVSLAGIAFTGTLAVTGLRDGNPESVGLFIPCAWFALYLVAAFLPAAEPREGG